MPELGARFFRPCAASTGRVRSRLPLSPMNLMARRATTMAPCVRIDRAASPTCRKPRKKTAKAGFTLASTGLSTRRKQLRWGGAWQTTFSSTPLHLSTTDSDGFWEHALPNPSCMKQVRFVGLIACVAVLVDCESTQTIDMANGQDEFALDNVSDRNASVRTGRVSR